MKQLYLILFIQFALLSFSYSAISGNELKLVVEFYRHGARMGFNDNLYPTNWTGYFFGELTPVGKRQQYILGEQLRERYIVNNSFLSETYNPSEIYVNADHCCERTIDSAQAHMLGLYPHGTQAQIPQGLNESYTFPPWEGINQSEFNYGLNATPDRIQMIPIHLSNDSLYSPRGDCKKSLKDALEDQQYATAFAQKIAKDFQPTFDILSETFNLTITMDNIFSLIDVIYTDYFQNQELPIVIPDSQIWKNISFLYQFHYTDINYGNTTEITNLFGTPFFTKIQELFDQKISGNLTDLKYYAFSGHDSTLGPILTAINATNIDCLYQQYLGQPTTSLNCVYGHPQFASNILVELYQDQTTNEYNIQILNNGQYLNLCEKQSIQCSYTEFKTRISAQQMNYDSLCM